MFAACSRLGLCVRDAWSSQAQGLLAGSRLNRCTRLFKECTRNVGKWCVRGTWILGLGASLAARVTLGSLAGVKAVSNVATGLFFGLSG